MDTSAILALTVGTVDGAPRAVDIQVGQDVALFNSSTIVTSTFGAGRGGDVVIEAPTVRLSDFSQIATNTFASGAGGDVILNVREFALLNTSIISSSSFGSDLNGDGVIDVVGGTGGTIAIQGLQGMGSAADSVTLSGLSGVTSDAFTGSAGGGGVSITATSVELKDFALIRSSTSSTPIDLNGDGIIDITGRAGDIVLNIQRAGISDGATIRSESLNNDLNGSEGGTITIQGLQGAGSKADSVAFSGAGIAPDSINPGRIGDVLVHAKTVSLTDGAVIQAGNPFSAGSAGNVTIDADLVGISGGGSISTHTKFLDAGQVTIKAKALTMDNGSIDTSTSSEVGGRGGDVVLQGGTVSLTNGAHITSQSGLFSTGRAGNITITGKSLTLESHSEINSSSEGIALNAGNSGNVKITTLGPFTSDASTITTAAENASGGNIEVTAQSVALSNGAVISASSQSPPLPDGGGNAGSITIHSGSTVVMHDSVITAEASHASGGEFTLTTPKMLWLTNSRISTAVFGDNISSSGGNITIDPQFVILQNSQIVANALVGLGGAINITAGVFLADPASIVEASSTLSINSTIQYISSELTPLNQHISSEPPLLTQSCAADSSGQFSSFVQTGRDGVPQVPGAVSPSPLSFLDTLTSDSLGSPSPNWAAARLELDRISVDASPRFYSACRS